jgi:hypothetical protein
MQGWEVQYRVLFRFFKLPGLFLETRMLMSGTTVKKDLGPAQNLQGQGVEVKTRQEPLKNKPVARFLP